MDKLQKILLSLIGVGIVAVLILLFAPKHTKNIEIVKNPTQNSEVSEVGQEQSVVNQTDDSKRENSNMQATLNEKDGTTKGEAGMENGQGAEGGTNAANNAASDSEQNSSNGTSGNTQSSSNATTGSQNETEIEIEPDEDEVEIMRPTEVENSAGDGNNEKNETSGKGDSQGSDEENKTQVPENSDGNAEQPAEEKASDESSMTPEESELRDENETPIL